MTQGDATRVRSYLGHIAQAIANIAEYTEGMDRVAYLSDRKTQDAVVRNLEIIGEACNNVAKQDPQFAAANVQIPWAVAYEMRNALAHGYFKVDQEIVWQTIQVDLPALHVSVLAVLGSLPGTGGG